MTLPKLAADKTPPNVALSAVNCECDTGVLRPTKAPSQVYLLPMAGDLRSIYKCGAQWLGFTNSVDFQRALVGDDRVLYTGDGYPKQTDGAKCISGGVPSLYPSDTDRLGVSRPSAALTVALSQYDTGEDYGDIIGTVSYVYTYVHYIDSTYAEESAPSPPTYPVSIRANEQATLTGFVVSTETGVNNLYFRIYRSLGGGDYEAVPTGRDGNGDFVFDMPVADTSFVDIDSTTSQIYQNVNILCETKGWDPLPDDATCICEYQNGIMAAISGKKVLLSEIFVPYAYPQGVSSSKDYTHTFATEPVSIAPYRDMLIVGLESNPWVISGSSLGETYQQEIPRNQACVGDMCTTEVGVFYPSNDGLVLCDGVIAESVTKDTYTIAQWRALGPENLKMFYHDDQLIGLFKGQATGFIFDFKGDKSIKTISLGTSVFYDGHMVPGEDRLYLLLYVSSAYYVYQWGGGDYEDMVYTGRFEFERQQPMFKAVRVAGDYDATKELDLTLTVDGVAHVFEDITDEPFWTGIKGWAKEVQYSLSGYAEVKEISFGGKPAELK